jgi:hypothetical protein
MLVAVSLATSFVSGAVEPERSPWARDGLFGRWNRADEVVALRTECSKTFDNHDGTFSLVVSGRLHRRDENGNWVELPESDNVRPAPRVETDDTARVGSGVGYDNEMWAADVPYFRSQHIYLSSELLFNGHVVGIGYFSDGDGGIGDTICLTQHWLEDVTYSTYNNTNWTGPGTMVWGGDTLTLPNLNGWVRLGLTTSFLHLHGNNLAVSYRHQDGSIERSQWYRVHSPGANRSKRGRSNSQNPPDMTLIPTRPDLELVYIPVYPDVQTTEIRAPKDTVVSGQSYTPQAVVRNNGPVRAVTFDVRLAISGGYSSTRTVTNLNSGSQTTVNFAGWTAAPLGPFAVVCSTRLSGDSVESNNRLTAEGFVRLLDVEVRELVSPPASVDSGELVRPRARVRNNGNTPVTFDVRFTVGDGYVSTQSVSGLGPGDETTVDFAVWQPSRRGSFATRCTAMLTGDQVPIGNWLNGSVAVAVHDLGAVAVVEPFGPLCDLTPQARVRNYGTLREPCAVVFSINSRPPYSDTLSLPAGLPLNVDTVVSFAAWTPVPGAWTARCSTALANDQVRDNDTASCEFTIAGIDIAVMAIRAPGTFIDTAMVVVPAGLVKNLGVAATGFTAFFAIESAGVPVYSGSVPVAELPVGAETVVLFDTWAKPHCPGAYVARCSVAAPGDQTNANDRLSMGFNILTDKLTYGWRIRADLPAGPSGKAPKDGAWLAYDKTSGLVYGAKGAKTPDFYVYDPLADTWAALRPFPAGTEGRPPYRGAVGCGNGSGLLYATRGNNTTGFWCYSAALDTWTQLADVPLGNAGKRVKGGTDLVYVPGAQDYVYCLKGYQDEFYRYNPTLDTWETRASPQGPVQKWNKGSWLVSDGAGTLYAHQAKYHNLFAYDIARDTWRRQANGMPKLSRYTGRAKKSKDGGSATFYGGAVLALKGGNTQEFWRYDVAGDSWHELDTMPAYGTTQKRKKVKAGADLVEVDGTFYAFKGNKTPEFWQYVPFPAPTESRSRTGVQVSSVIVGRGPSAVLPNPLRAGFVTVTAGGQAARWSSGPVTVSVHDATGRLVQRSAFGAQQSAVTLDLRRLSTGIYLLRIEAGGCVTTQKLVVRR